MWIKHRVRLKPVIRIFLILCLSELIFSKTENLGQHKLSQNLQINVVKTVHFIESYMSFNFKLPQEHLDTAIDGIKLRLVELENENVIENYKPSNVITEHGNLTIFGKKMNLANAESLCRTLDLSVLFLI
jgi:hypothetical protein